MRRLTLIAAAAALLASPALAHPPAAHQPAAQKTSAQPMQHQGMQHQNMPGMQHDMSQMMSGDMAMHGGPAGREYMQNMMRMHEAMMQAQDRDPTRAWALKMIPHHQGAINNSRTVLKYAQDAEARRQAEKTIRENEKGIQDLRKLLARLPARR